MKLKNRINLYTVVLFIILLVIMNVVVYYMFSQMTIKNELEQTLAEAENTLEGMNQAIEQAPLEVLLRSYVPISGMIRILQENGEGPAPVTSMVEAELAKLEPITFPNQHEERINFNGKSYSFVSLPIILPDGQVGNLQIVKSLEKVMKDLQILQWVLVAVTGIVMIPVLISSRVLSQLITTPITSMIRTMKEIQESGRFQTIKLQGDKEDELMEMGSTFNHMIAILKSNAEKQEQFVSSASHELKTPLTVIESYSSLLKRRGKKEPEIFDEAVEAIHSEAIRMRELTEQLLMLAKPHEKWNVEMEAISLTEFVQVTVKIFEKGFDRKVNMNIEKDADITSDKAKLKQLLYIFLDNARKYSEEDILLIIGEVDGYPYIRIQDRGVGIPRESLPKIFDRFYRVDKARTRKLGGTGLGLSLAKELADVLQIELEVDSLEGVGTTVTMRFQKCQ